MNNYQLSVKKYPSYKNSGVEWLSDVPEHWELRRLKDISQITRGAILRPVDDPSYFDENGEWYYLNISDVTKCDKFLYTAKLKLSELGSRKSARVLPNNIILTASATIGKPTINKVKVCVHDGFIPFKQIQCNITYLYYFLLNSSIYNALGKSNTQKNIYLDEVKTVSIAVPSQAEQKLIALYLDTKTAQIDRKIDLLTQKATQYGNLKQSLINETVTRGLDKSVPMKDSGIEAIGEMPEHWEIKHLKDLAEIKGGKDSKLVEIETEGYPVYGSGGIFGRASQYLHNKPSVLLGRKGTIDKPLFVTEAFWSVDTMFYTDIKNSSCPKFFYYQCLTIQFGLYQYGSAVPSMAQNVLRQILFATPPLSEQKTIADYLDTKITKIDKIIQTLNTQIEKLKELRKTIINDVVTGKIKVIGE